MSIGINWKEVWDDVWKDVWRQTAVVATTATDDKPKRRVSRSRITLRKPLVPKPPRKPRTKKAAKLLPPIVLPEPIVAIPPPSPLERFAETLSSVPAIEGVISSTLGGCTLKMVGIVGNSGRISSQLDAPDCDMALKVQVYDDVLSLYLQMPELEPELVDA